MMRNRSFTLQILLIVIATLLCSATLSAKAKAFLGVNCIDIQLDSLQRLGLSNSTGVLIVQVTASSPAEIFGLKVDDVITAIGKTKIDTMKDFIKAMNQYRAKQKATISVIRNGETKSIPIVFGARQAPLGPSKLSFDSDKESKINKLMDYVNEHNASMGSLAIGKGKSILYSQAMGFSQVLDTGSQNANPNTKYRVGSISKIFTSVMIHQLMEEGKLQPNTKLDQFFPAIPNAKKITIRMMLTHQSGIASFTDCQDYLEWSLKPHSREEIIQKILEQTPSFKPGKKMQYSNSNYLLLGYIIEKLDNTEYQISLQRRITQKIGLTNTYYGGKIRPEENEAYSYYNTGAWHLNPETDMSIPGGAGAIVSTASDLVIFIQSLFEGDLVSQKSLKQMTNWKNGMGSGLFQIKMGNNTYFGHGGRIDSFNSMLIYSPIDKHALAYLENGNADISLSIIALVSGIMSDQYVILPTYQESIPSTDLDRYLGTYTNQSLPMTITITNDDSELYLQAEGQEKVKMQAISENIFTCQAIGLKIVFEEDVFTLYQHNQQLRFLKK